MLGLKKVSATSIKFRHLAYRDVNTSIEYKELENQVRSLYLNRNGKIIKKNILT